MLILRSILIILQMSAVSTVSDYELKRLNRKAENERLINELFGSDSNKPVVKRPASSAIDVSSRGAAAAPRKQLPRACTAQKKRTRCDSDNDPDYRPNSKTKKLKLTNPVAAAATPPSEPRQLPPRRGKTACVYKESDERSLYCYDCCSEVFGDCCPKHQRWIPNLMPEELGTVENFAELTLPDGMRICRSAVGRHAGSGVWAEAPIPRGTIFGPYLGQRITDKAKAEASSYAWEIRLRNKSSEWVDAADKRYSNWMRYVNCSRNLCEQNMIAFQWDSDVYYIAIRDISPDHELLVYYGDEMAKLYNIVAEDGDSASDRPLYEETDILLAGGDLVCGFCEKVFKNKASKIVHVKSVHLLERRHLCSVCNARFQSESHLSTHKRIHTGEKPFVCNICEKAFNVSSALQTHKRIHTGEKPYVCNICEKAFIQSSNLQTHKRIHTGEKPYVCNICEKAFNVSSALQTHKRIHTGEKPFVCNICEKA